MEVIDFPIFDGVFSVEVSSDTSVVFTNILSALDYCHSACPHRKREIDDFFIALIRDAQFIAQSKQKKD